MTGKKVIDPGGIERGSRTRLGPVSLSVRGAIPLGKERGGGPAARMEARHRGGERMRAGHVFDLLAREGRLQVVRGAHPVLRYDQRHCGCPADDVQDSRIELPLRRIRRTNLIIGLG